MPSPRLWASIAICAAVSSFETASEGVSDAAATCGFRATAVTAMMTAGRQGRTAYFDGTEAFDTIERLVTKQLAATIIHTIDSISQWKVVVPAIAKQISCHQYMEVTVLDKPLPGDKSKAPSSAGRLLQRFPTHAIRVCLGSPYAVIDVMPRSHYTHFLEKADHTVSPSIKDSKALKKDTTSPPVFRAYVKLSKQIWHSAISEASALFASKSGARSLKRLPASTCTVAQRLTTASDLPETCPWPAAIMPLNAQTTTTRKSALTPSKSSSSKQASDGAKETASTTVSSGSSNQKSSEAAKESAPVNKASSAVNGDSNTHRFAAVGLDAEEHNDGAPSQQTLSAATADDRRCLRHSAAVHHRGGGSAPARGHGSVRTGNKALAFSSVHAGRPTFLAAADDTLFTSIVIAEEAVDLLPKANCLAYATNTPFGLGDVSRRRCTPGYKYGTRTGASQADLNSALLDDGAWTQSWDRHNTETWFVADAPAPNIPLNANAAQTRDAHMSHPFFDASLFQNYVAEGTLRVGHVPDAVCDGLMGALVRDGLQRDAGDGRHEVAVFAHRRVGVRRPYAHAAAEVARTRPYFVVKRAAEEGRPDRIVRKAADSALADDETHVVIRGKPVFGPELDYHFHRRNADTPEGHEQWSDKNGENAVRGPFRDVRASDDAEQLRDYVGLAGRLGEDGHYLNPEVTIATAHCGTLYSLSGQLAPLAAVSRHEGLAGVGTGDCAQPDED